MREEAIRQQRVLSRSQSVAYGTLLSIAIGVVLRVRHLAAGVEAATSPTRWVADVAIAAPITILVAAVCALLVRRMIRATSASPTGVLAHASFAVTVGTAYALATVPASAVSTRLSGDRLGFGHLHESIGATHAFAEASSLIAPVAMLAAIISLVVGLPWQWRAIDWREAATWEHPRRARLRQYAIVTVALVVGIVPMLPVTPGQAAPLEPGAPPEEPADAFSCAGGLGMPWTPRTVRADVVALDQEIVYNRLGVVNPTGMMYALRSDVVDKTTGKSETEGATLTAGNVMLRLDKRPRPLTLRVNAGDCLEIHFQNLLNPTALSNQPADRNVGVHVNGMQVVGDIGSDGSFVGTNESSLVAPGGSTVYTLFAEYENTFLLYNMGSTIGGEGGGGTISEGLFGAVNVEPAGTVWYRSQLTRLEMDLAASAWIKDDDGTFTATDEPQFEVIDGIPTLAVRLTADGHPVMNYDARYPTVSTTPGYDPAKVDTVNGELVGQPIVNMLDDRTLALAHSDLNAVISGPASNGYQIPKGSYPESYWANPMTNVGGSRGYEPFREFTVIFHDEVRVLQAFPEFFDDPTLSHTLHGVKDGFAINYGTGGIGAEIIGNRIGVGPMRECVECKYEEFFLTAWAVGDPAMIVDIPANADAAGVPTNLGGGPVKPGAKATKALYPDDPSNVHHSYLGDRVKFRNLHAGPKEHHVFHLHAQQWQYDWNSQKSGYLDSQNIGPGGGFTYEIAYGGSGNRNSTPGDMIFHCHFYPHFAQGMWELWRVHDVFERGTLLDPATIALDPATGRPVLAGDLGAPVADDPTTEGVNEGARALPDGEIAVGTPIPAVVPLPSRPMAPTPAPVSVASDGASAQIDVDNNGHPDFRQVDLGTGDGFQTGEFPVSNPGFPFWVPGVAGHRPPTPPMDLKKIENPDGTSTTVDGGLQRHVILDGEAVSFETRLDFNKELTSAKLGYVPEEGTPAERAAMGFHGGDDPESFRPDGTSGPFHVNGLPAQQGAPFADPCRKDDGTAINVNRTYKAAVIELPVRLNKEGWHFQQQRILTLNDDVRPTMSRARAPEPLVMRVNANDCVRFEHTNLVPNVYELDDFQVRTPTDIIGQHIHLVKFDVTASDGSANGYNYEDGTLSPEEVVERIHAVRHASGNCNDAVTDPNGNGLRDDGPDQRAGTPSCPLAEKHPEFGDVAELGHLAWGARTTVQRWYADPLLNDSWDGGVGSVFTHDHYGPSTHQQVGLYATVLVEPENSEWKHNETGVLLGTRGDGGPTTWQAQIVDEKLPYVPARGGPPFEPHREFYFEFADFQHAYEEGGGGVGTIPGCQPPPGGGCIDNGAGEPIPSYADFPNAVNPSVRREPPSGHEADLVFFPGDDLACPGGHPRPCPEAISAEDPGTYVVNYRNEPVGLRISTPAGTQAPDDAGDTAFAYASIERARPKLNTQPTTYPPLTADVGALDPYTPMIRAYMGDKVRVRVQVGAHEEEHTFTIHGMKWRQEALNLNSGWRNSASSGISEYFVLDTPVVPDVGAGTPAKVDYLYTMGAATEDLWNGVWGLFRTYGKARKDLASLPGSPMGDVKGNKGLTITNIGDFEGDCPAISLPAREYKVAAVLAADVLPPDPLTSRPGGLIYNDRATSRGPLYDPDALIYVMYDDIVFDDTGRPVGLRDGTPLDPLVLRARSGECIQTDLVNLLPNEQLVDLPGYNSLPPIVKKDRNVNGNGGITTFNSNDVRPSNVVGFTPQLVHVNMRTDGSFWVGQNSHSPIRPGESGRYRWYAGDYSTTNMGGGQVKLNARPVEFGTANLMPTDTIEGASKGLVGALVIEPPTATWETDPGSNVEATVTFTENEQEFEFREFVTVIQNDVNLRWGSGCTPSAPNLQCAVPNLSAADDAQDTGAKTINYGADPLWYRLGIDPNTDFSAPELRDNLDAHRVYSNEIFVDRNAGDEARRAAREDPANDPQTAVFEVSPYKSQFIRMRVAMPGGHARGIEFTTHGHAWQRQPYIENSDRMSWGFHDDPTRLVGGGADGQMSTHNMVGWWISSQESISASSHHDLQFRSGGGRDRVKGDFLFRDFASFGNLSGIWGIIRHQASPAMARVDRYQAPHGSTLEITDPSAGLLANDVDLDGHSFAVVGLRASGLTTSNVDGSFSAETAHGTVTVFADGTFDWRPIPGFTGIDGFEYEVTDGATASVTIMAGNTPPHAVDGFATTHGGTGSPGRSVTIDILGTSGTTPLAGDDDGDALTVSTTHPGAIVEPDGSIVYTPPADLDIGTGVEVSIPYTVSDGFGGSATANITVTVNPNTEPTAMPGTASTPVGVPVVIQVVGACDPDAAAPPAPIAPAIACDPDGDDLSVTSPDAADNGDGSITYTPPTDLAGLVTNPVVISYTVDDRYGGVATATISVDITVNQPPVAAEGSATTIMGTPVGIMVIGVCDPDAAAPPAPTAPAIACDPDDEPLDLIMTNPNVTVNDDGTITYQPPDGFSGTEAIGYTVTDGSGAWASNTINVTVTDTVTITKAQFAQRQKRWTVSGTVGPAAANVAVTIKQGATIATVFTDATGAWSARIDNGTADCSVELTATSARGGTASVPVECRR